MKPAARSDVPGSSGSVYVHADALRAAQYPRCKQAALQFRQVAVPLINLLYGGFDRARRD